MRQLQFPGPSVGPLGCLFRREAFIVFTLRNPVFFLLPFPLSLSLSPSCSLVDSCLALVAHPINGPDRDRRPLAWHPITLSPSAKPPWPEAYRTPQELPWRAWARACRAMERGDGVADAGMLAIRRRRRRRQLCSSQRCAHLLQCDDCSCKAMVLTQWSVPREVVALMHTARCHLFSLS